MYVCVPRVCLSAGRIVGAQGRARSGCSVNVHQWKRACPKEPVQWFRALGPPGAGRSVSVEPREQTYSFIHSTAVYMHLSCQVLCSY